MILNTAKDYYENDKERLRKQARDKYRNSSEEQKNEKRAYGKKRYHKKISVGLKRLNLIVR